MVDALGFIGVGAMGSGMARRMAHGGPRLFVHDLDTTAVERLLDAGIGVAHSPKDIGDLAEIVFLCMPNLKAGEAVMLGEGGLAQGRKVKAIVDLSTTGARFAENMSAALQQHGIVYLASPISGGLAGAAAGTLAVMTSGPKQVFDLIEPYLQRIGKNIFFVGEQPGHAQTMKLINNIISSTGFVNTCQAMVFGTKAGLDPDMMVEVFNSGTGRNAATLGKVPKGILPRSFDHGSKTYITAKDVELCIEEADAMGIELSVAKAAQQIWRHMMSHGGADDDNTTIIKYIEEPAGVVVQGKAARDKQRSSSQ